MAGLALSVAPAGGQQLPPLQFPRVPLPQSVVVGVYSLIGSVGGAGFGAMAGTVVATPGCERRYDRQDDALRAAARAAGDTSTFRSSRPPILSCMHNVGLYYGLYAGSAVGSALASTAAARGEGCEEGSARRRAIVGAAAGTLPLVLWMASSRDRRPHYDDYVDPHSGRGMAVAAFTPATQAAGVIVAMRGCRRALNFRR